MITPSSRHPRALLFDLFGTLVTIQDKRAPYRQLVSWAIAHDALPPGFASADLMRRSYSLEMAAALLTKPVPLAVLGEWQNALQRELASIALLPGVAETLPMLASQGYVMGVCSNLASPYGPPALTCLASVMEPVQALSYEVGAVKPELQMYQTALRRLSTAAQDVLFVGDTFAADVDGPRTAGMPSLWLTTSASSVPAIRSIDQLPGYLARLPLSIPDRPT